MLKHTGINIRVNFSVLRLIVNIFSKYDLNLKKIDY